ncbi:hypothetical protein [Rhizobium leguminosarum]|uniref:hypothetical protein n=1 Tax=Rhizobium leguminosarum TaxID=384 RepID=UPI0014419105|nr:hypothetical protein [Rhizobium leguminosarum]MBY5868402.1 hypothetical protein [Rhizobium leguminosarum]NKM08551.1 hypothetical protein [Rhizobium leguminosarum bv. viciae]
MKSMVDGARVTGEELDRVLDWLDKVRASAAHMATAFSGHGLVLHYEDHAFPNWRIGLFDRVAFFFRVDTYQDALDLWECTDPGFLTTPGALAIRIKDLVIVTVSNNFLLSEAFGLMNRIEVGGMLTDVLGNDEWAAGFGFRRTRLEKALVVAQPMRRHHLREGLQNPSRSLKENGDGNVYHLEEGRWRRTKSIDFAALHTMPYELGYTLSCLEMIEWLLWQKHNDYVLSGRPEGFAAKQSAPRLNAAKQLFIDRIGRLKSGDRPSWDNNYN